MAGEEFAALVGRGLLKEVEETVVHAYLDLHPGSGRPAAYRWLRYEDPEPVERLVEGVRRLRGEWARFDRVAVDKACNLASQMGYLN